MCIRDRNALIDYWRQLHTANGYVEVSTPMIMNRHLWETSGHWDHYKDNMYSTLIDDEVYCIKPCLLYTSPSGAVFT